MHYNTPSIVQCVCVCVQVLLCDLADLAAMWGLAELEYITMCLLANGVDTKAISHCKQHQLKGWPKGGAVCVNNFGR